MDACVDDALTRLSSMKDLPGLLESVIIGMKSDFRFLGMFLLCFTGWECDANLLANLRFLVNSIAELVKIETIDSNEAFTSSQSVVAKVFDKIRECKVDIKKYSLHLIPSSLKAEPCTHRETMKFLDYVLANINNLVKCQMDDFLEPLEERVFLLRNLVYFTSLCRENWEESLGFEFNIHSWTNKAACLILLHWLNDTKDEETVEELKRLQFDLLQNFNPRNSDFIKLCFKVMKDPKLKRLDVLIFGEFVSRFVDFFLDNLVLLFKDDGRMIREGLTLLINFLADPPANTELSFISKQIYAVLDQASHTICVFGETNLDLAKGKTTLYNLQKSVDEVRSEVEKIFVDIPYSSWSNFPRTNGLGYFEFLLVYLENLKETMIKNKRLVPFLKDGFTRIQEELLPLRSFLQGISTIQNEHKELNDLWEQIINLSYQADLTIKSSFLIDHPIWYNMICLSFVVGKIKYIRYKVMKIKGRPIHENEAILSLRSSIDVVIAPNSTSTDEVVVGFKHEIKELIDCLIRGTTRLDIVSIVGMGGIGKTTLAKKLFNAPSVTQHFHVRAFCTFSQRYIKRNVLLEVLKNSCEQTDYEVLQRSDDDDLASKVRQSLLHRRFLIVIDDIWDIDAWNDVRHSFPDDNNGSRVIFTTRINDISYNTPYLLPFLSIDESWELLQQNIFHKNPCPPHLYKVGKLIAKKCQGLPLAIVVIAGLLAKTERTESQWNDVLDNLNTFASSEGCKDIIKLSYEKLPEALKSCFLYFGAFREDEILKAKRLTLLWVAEGFILKSGSSCLRKDAKKYLKGLGDMNLITVIKRSLNGGIKSFRVHDLIRDFCIAQAQDEHFLYFTHNNNSPMLSVFDQYRVCIQDKRRPFHYTKPTVPSVHSLLYFFKVNHEENSLKFFLHNFKLVQILDLLEVKIVGEFPTVITTLIHLRYLALRFLTAPYVPPEISNLSNLETFLLFEGLVFGLRSSPAMRVTVCGYKPCVQRNYPMFSNGIWKLKRLKHVETDFQGAEVALDDITGVSSQLHELETFISLSIPSGKDGDELLRRLPNIRKLSCSFHGLWDPDRKCYQLPKLEILPNLESLIMIHIGDYICHPEMLSFPITIRKLTLQNFHIPWNEFSAIIGRLHRLQVLVLHQNAFNGKIWDTQDVEFPNIKSLTLEKLDIEEWKADIYSFPSLEKLRVSLCSRLIEIPPCFGEVSTLNSISVRFCGKPVVKSAIHVQKDQFDLGNESFEVNLVSSRK